MFCTVRALLVVVHFPLQCSTMSPPPALVALAYSWFGSTMPRGGDRSATIGWYVADPHPVFTTGGPFTQQLCIEVTPLHFHAFRPVRVDGRYYNKSIPPSISHWPADPIVVSAVRGAFTSNCTDLFGAPKEYKARVCYTPRTSS